MRRLQFEISGDKIPVRLLKLRLSTRRLLTLQSEPGSSVPDRLRFSRTIFFTVTLLPSQVTPTHLLVHGSDEMFHPQFVVVCIGASLSMNVTSA